jgi:hypothetical protein
MASTSDLVDVLKAELKAHRLTYGGLARQLGMSESNVKRMFSRGDMPLTRIDHILRLLKMDMADLAKRLLDSQPLRRELTLEQERAVVADPKLLLMAICCLSQWTFDQIVQTYAITQVEAIRYLARLDRLQIIELRPLNRYRLKVDKTFRWRANGPAMRYFRAHVVNEYFEGGFDSEGEMLSVVQGSISPALAASFSERLQRVAHDFAQQHLADQKLPDSHRRPYTLLLSVRSWWLSAFRELKRSDASPPAR